MAEEEDYKICVAWEDSQGGGGAQRKIVNVAPRQTLQSLRDAAAAWLGGGGGAVTLLAGFPPQPLVAEGLVRDAIPSHSKIWARPAAAAGAAQEAAAASSTKKKKRGQRPNEERGGGAESRKKRQPQREVVDLTGGLDDDDDDDDDAVEIVSIVEKAAASKKKRHKTEQQDDDDDDPTTVTHTPWIFKHCAPRQHETALGKWLIFEPESTVNAVWQRVWPLVVAGQLGGALSCKVATRRGSQMSEANKPNNSNSKKKKQQPTYVICVYTAQQSLRSVGTQLCHLLHRDLHYKTDRATLANRYSHNNSSNISALTCYCNRGRPTLEKPPFVAPAESRRLAAAAAAMSGTGTRRASLLLTHAFEIVLTCVGLEHHGVDSTALQSAAAAAATQSFTLVREPDNRYDPLAIAVYMDRSSSSSGQRQKIGHVISKKPLCHAPILAPWLDRSLVKIETCALRRVAGASTVDITVRGRAVPGAAPVLATL